MSYRMDYWLKDQYPELGPASSSQAILLLPLPPSQSRHHNTSPHSHFSWPTYHFWPALSNFFPVPISFPSPSLISKPSNASANLPSSTFQCREHNEKKSRHSPRCCYYWYGCLKTTWWICTSVCLMYLVCVCYCWGIESLAVSLGTWFLLCVECRRVNIIRRNYASWSGISFII